MFDMKETEDGFILYHTDIEPEMVRVVGDEGEIINLVIVLNRFDFLEAAMLQHKTTEWL